MTIFADDICSSGCGRKNIDCACSIEEKNAYYELLIKNHGNIPYNNPSFVSSDIHKRAQRKRNLEMAQMAENAALGVQNFTPDHYENGGEDFLDRLFRTGIPAEIRGAMKFTIGKYADRLGKKDDQVKELDKIIDYATRYKTHLLGDK